MSTQGVKAGDAYVEVGGRRTPAEAAIERVQTRIKGIATTSSSALRPVNMLRSALAMPFGIIGGFAAIAGSIWGAVRATKALYDRFHDVEGKLERVKAVAAEMQKASAASLQTFLVDLGVEKAEDPIKAQTEAIRDAMKERDEAWAKMNESMARMGYAPGFSPSEMHAPGETASVNTHRNYAAALEAERAFDRGTAAVKRQQQALLDLVAAQDRTAAAAKTAASARELQQEHGVQAWGIMAERTAESKRRTAEIMAAAEAKEARDLAAIATAERELRQLRREAMSDEERLRDINAEKLEQVEQLRAIGTRAAMDLADQIEKALGGDLARRLKDLDITPEVAKERISSRGQFGGAGAALTFGGDGSRTLEKHLSVAERSQRTLVNIEENTRNAGGVFT